MKLKTYLMTLLMLLIASPAFALSLDQAKQQGLVGETASGYLAARKTSSAANALVTSINAKRRTHYQSISKRNGAPISSVEQMAGKKLIQRAAKGEYYNSGGGWMRR
ncbi:MAG: YdbL family protein [Gammaproteobacteria bacterium]|nr:YdbL family protein [Gammaproteobacteria bacterium]